MRKVLLVIRHEISRTVGKPSFWLTTLVFPMIIFAITFGSQLLAESMTNGDSEAEFMDLVTGATAPGAQKPMGYVDHAGVIETMPEGFPTGMLVPFADEAAAEDALAEGAIDQFYIVPHDLLNTGEILLTQEQFSPFDQLRGGNIFEYVVTYNLTGDADVTALLLNPVPQTSSRRLEPSEDGPGSGVSAGGVPSMAPLVMLFIFFFVLTMSSSFVLRSVTREKESRVVEVLLSSLDPRELMLGKLLGLCAVALIQMAIWFGGGLLILREKSPLFGLASMAMSLKLPPGFVILAVLYFLLGYLTFASALGAIGTLAPNAREGSQFTFIALLPLMIPMWLNATFLQAPGGPFVTFLSIFPLTSPVSMIARMTAVTVPLWQIVLSLGLQAVTTYFLVLLAARFFRADTLLSGAPLSFKRIREGLRRPTTN